MTELSALPSTSASKSSLQPRRIPPVVRGVGRHWQSLLLMLITLLFLAPLVWVFTHSFMSAHEFAENRPRFWPEHPTFSNYTTVLVKDAFLRYIGNSLIVASITTAITLVFGSLGGYAISRLPIRGASAMLGFVTLAGFFPLTAMMGPLFILWRDLGLLDSYLGLAISDLIYTLPLATWLLASLFSQLPDEIEEAAIMDGCNRVQALWRVVVPVAAPAVATAGIFSFILAWSDFAFSLVFLQTQSRFTAPLAIIAVGQSKYQTFYNYTDAAVIITAVPIIVLVLLAQRRIVSGLSSGAVK